MKRNRYKTFRGERWNARNRNRRLERRVRRQIRNRSELRPAHIDEVRGKKKPECNRVHVLQYRKRYLLPSCRTAVVRKPCHGAQARQRE